MSDLSSKTPMKSLSNKTYLLIAAVIVVAIVLIFACVMLANAKAKSYEKSYATWDANGKQTLLNATTKLPKNLYFFDNETTKKSIAAERAACNNVQSTLNTVKDAKSKKPGLAFVPFGALNKSYSDAAKLYDKRAKVIDPYITDAMSTFEHIATDCSWNIKLNEKAAGSNELYTEATKYLMAKGAVESGSRCNRDDGCISTIKSKRDKYADLYKKASEDSKKVIGVFTEPDCAKTSFGKYCTRVNDAYLASYNSLIKYSDVVKNAHTVVSNPDISAASEAVRLVNNKIDELTFEAYKTMYPNYAFTESLKADPSSDSFFDAVAKGRVKELLAKQAEVKSL